MVGYCAKAPAEPVAMLPGGVRGGRPGSLRTGAAHRKRVTNTQGRGRVGDGDVVVLADMGGGGEFGGGQGHRVYRPLREGSGVGR